MFNLPHCRQLKSACSRNWLDPINLILLSVTGTWTHLSTQYHHIEFTYFRSFYCHWSNEETKLYLISKEKRSHFGSRSRVFIRRRKFSVKPANGRARHEDWRGFKLVINSEVNESDFAKEKSSNCFLNDLFLSHSLTSVTPQALWKLMNK